MKQTETPLDIALRIAVEAHAGQKDKSGAPYILHPLRVMSQMECEEGMMAGVLHDVVEDTAVTLTDLQQAGIPDRVVQAVDCLTKRDDEPATAYLSRVKANALATRVKRADIADNTSPDRLSLLPESEQQRLREKYAGALGFLAADPL